MGKKEDKARDPKKLAYLELDDLCRHGAGCPCGLCDWNGKSFGVSIRYILDSEDPIERVYACSEESAFHNARLICDKEDLPIVEFDKESDCISGKVEVDLDEIIGRSLESFLDLLSVRLTGTDLLMEVDYDIAGFEYQSLTFKVSGRLDGIRDVYGGEAVPR